MSAIVLHGLVDHCNAWTPCCTLRIGLFRPRDGLCAYQLVVFTPSPRLLASPSSTLSLQLKRHMKRQPSLANATSAHHFDSRQSNITRDVHDNSLVRPLFGRHALAETHFTAYRTIWDPCTFLYSLFVLEHRPAHSVPVYNTLCLAQSRHRIISLACASSHSLHLLRITQPCRWSRECPSQSASSRPVSTSRAQPSRITHTLSLPPALAGLTTANPPPLYSLLLRTLVQTIRLRYTIHSGNTVETRRTPIPYSLRRASTQPLFL